MLEGVARVGELTDLRRHERTGGRTVAAPGPAGSGDHGSASPAKLAPRPPCSQMVTLG